MIEIKKMTGTKEENYALALKQVQAMIHGEPNLIANLSNVSSIINQALSDINWVGFYYLKKNKSISTRPLPRFACVHSHSTR